jgi:hypothetical protein
MRLYRKEEKRNGKTRLPNVGDEQVNVSPTGDAVVSPPEIDEVESNSTVNKTALDQGLWLSTRFDHSHRWGMKDALEDGDRL